MDVCDMCELRLVRCAFFQPAAVADKSMHTDSALESSLLRAVELIEKGLYSQVPSMDVMREVFGVDCQVFCTNADPNAVARVVYDQISRNVQSFLDRIKSSVANVLMLTAGVALLFIFVQSNFTGPQVDFPVFPFNVAWNLAFWNPAAEQAWDAWARSELMADGCDVIGKFACPQYLLLANILFGVIKLRQEPSSLCWWASRALFLQQRMLEERSHTLLRDVTSGYSTVVKIFGTKFMEHDGWYSHLTASEKGELAASAFLEAALVEYYYGHADEARLYIVQAEKASGLKYSVEGAMGYRRQHQIDPKAQMVLRDEAELDALPDEVDKVQEPSVDVDVLLQPRLESSDVQYLHLKALSGTHQALILARCLDVKKKNADDELTSWEMAPYIEAVDAQQSSPFMVKCWRKLLRVEWEKSRGPTRERAFLLMDNIVADIRNGPVAVSERMDHFFCVSFPCLQALMKQYAHMLIGFGNVGEALKLFEELEMWHNLIDCHRLLGDRARAVSLIKERLEVSPLDPRLWCSLGDATSDDTCFIKSWEVSGGRFAAAQRCLARSALNRKDYVEAVKHWDMALALNPLYADGWFSLGFAALKADQLDKALDAYIRTVQMDTENGEAFNNIAALHMRRKSYKEATLAFERAVKFKRNSFELWDNYSQALFEVGRYSQAIMAQLQVFDLSPKNADIDLLSKLVQVVENKKEQIRDPERELDRETKNLVDMLGRFLSKLALSGNYGGEIWGLKARWHKSLGELDACSEALIKQLRAYQGSNWQHDKNRFRVFAQASLQLCRVYEELANLRGGKRELSAAQRHLLSTLKQGDQFRDSEEYKALDSLYASVQSKIMEQSGTDSRPS